MHRRTMPQEAIDTIKAAGYRVFMRDRADSYAIFASDSGIAYVQFDPMEGYTIFTKHYPNHESGTGYQIERGVSTLEPDTLARAIEWTVPPWAHGHKTPRKYSGMEKYRASGVFESDYVEV